MACNDKNAVNYNANEPCRYLEKHSGTCYLFEESTQIVDRSFTVSFSPESKGWVFFHDYVPDMYFSTRDQLYTAKDNGLYKHNAGPKGVYYNNTPKSFFIDMVFRSDDEMTLNSLSWATEVLSAAGDYVEFKTLSHITIWNSYQSSGRIPVTPELVSGGNSRKTQSQWFLNDFQDIAINRSSKLVSDLFSNFNIITSTIDPNMSWYDKQLFEDKYFVVRFEFDNANNDTIFIHDVDADVSKSYL